MFWLKENGKYRSTAYSKYGITCVPDHPILKWPKRTKETAETVQLIKAEVAKELISFYLPKRFLSLPKDMFLFT